MPQKFESTQPSAGRFVDGDERAEYTGRAMKLLDVQHQPSAKFGPRWVITAVMLDTGELIALAIADNATRTAMFGQVRAAIDADGADAYDPVCLLLQDRVDGGHPYWTFVSATDEQIAEAAEIAETDAGDDDPEAGGVPDDNPADAGEAEAVPVKRGRK